MISNIYTISSLEEAEIYTEKIFSSRCNLFGFDTETTINRSDDKGKVSLIQIYQDGYCYLYQVYRIWKNTGVFPPKLAKFLSNPNYIKVGVAADNDAYLIEKSYNIRVYGVVDIQYIARSMNIPDISMTGLVARFDIQVYKQNKSNIWTDWDIDLNQKHIQYAAFDSLISLLIYQKLFHIQERETNVSTFKEDEEDTLLLSWIKKKKILPSKNMNTLTNYISNSYKRWMKMYTLHERLTLAEKAIQRYIEKKQIHKDIYSISLVEEKQEDTSLTGSVFSFLKYQFGSRRKKESLINQLCNSSNVLLRYPSEQRRDKAEEMLNLFVQEGKLIYNNEYYYLPE